jgi:outer membrane protein assembly factor BamB/calcineurin-like phosphoesterase family protein
MKYLLFFFTTFYFSTNLFAQQEFQFALITDLHIGSSSADEDLRRTVNDINQNNTIKFVIASGDITEFGSDAELALAKQILDSLNKPWYIIPGNHDNNWSESGTNSFVKIFGSETFFFNYGGYYFLGNNCGPNMKMSPGQIPYENIVWMDSVLHTIPKKSPIIFVNHYPLDSSLNNWYEATDRLRKYNTQLTLGGHWHRNTKLNFDDIPAILGRSNLRAKDAAGGYNIIKIKNDTAFFQTRITANVTQDSWAIIPLINHDFAKTKEALFRPSYAVNSMYSQVEEVWRFQDSSDIGSGFVLDKNKIITADAKGRILAIDVNTKKVIWRFVTNGKIYSTPALFDNHLVIPSTDGNVYCLNATNGKLLWKYETKKAIVASPLIEKKSVFIGSSEGKFFALDLYNGKLKWVFTDAKGFQKSTPLYYNNKIFFGGWGNEFYALDADNGKLIWKYSDGYSNRMLSPASCIPVATKSFVYIVAPDRYMTKLNAETGKMMWKKTWENNRVRESMGMSKDSSLIFAKTMQGNLIGVKTNADTAFIAWQTPIVFGYELNPSVIIEKKGVVYALSDKGVIAAFDRKTGEVKWIHKVSNSLVNDLKFLNNNECIVSTMDGKLVRLKIDSAN